MNDRNKRLAIAAQFVLADEERDYLLKNAYDLRLDSTRPDRNSSKNRSLQMSLRRRSSIKFEISLPLVHGDNRKKWSLRSPRQPIPPSYL